MHQAKLEHARCLSALGASPCGPHQRLLMRPHQRRRPCTAGAAAGPHTQRRRPHCRHQGLHIQSSCPKRLCEARSEMTAHGASVPFLQACTLASPRAPGQVSPAWKHACALATAALCLPIAISRLCTCTGAEQGSMHAPQQHVFICLPVQLIAACLSMRRTTLEPNPAWRA